MIGMKKRKLLSVLLLMLFLTACGGAGNSNSAPAAAGEQVSDESGWADVPQTDQISDYNESSTVPANTKMIYSADISMETREYEQAEQAVGEIVGELGGWFESRSTYRGGGYRSLDCTIRIPVKNYYLFLERVGQAAHVTRQDEYTDDVSEVYYDNESRLATQRTKLERLQALLAKAENMADIISLESAISETELEIEHLTGSLRNYDSLIDYSTITLRLQEVYRLSNEEEPAVTFGQRLTAAFSIGLQRGVGTVEEFAVGIAQNWLLLILIAAVVTAVLFFRKKFRGPKPVIPEKTPEKKE